MNKRIVTFPVMGNYYVAEKTVGRLLGDEVIVPPKITRKTLELGVKYSPEAVCIPFKYMLGNFIESLELGATVLALTGGGCRLGCYAEVQAAILSKLGYEFEFVKLTNSHNIIHIAHNIKHIYPYLSYFDIGKTLYLAYEQAKAIDEIEAFARENVGFETNTGSFDRLLKRFITTLDHTTTISEVRDLKKTYMAKLRALDIHKPAYPLRVGIVGEIYVMMEPFSNFFIENQLAQYGVEVHRFVTISGVVQDCLFYNKYVKHVLSLAAPYLHTGDIGGHGAESVAIAHSLAKEGFDGLIHVKPFGCLPEINAMPALHNISRDYKFPIIYFSFDTLTSETGIKTRLEAFYDMLVMRGENHGCVH
jgi:predicted nucleotide-binding protein (sugar kinase/HSP70/actin superfamily)